MHSAHLYGFEQAYHHMGIKWYLVEGTVGICGAALYALRFPERLSPGTFDIWGQSYSLLHMLVLVAAAAHLMGVLTAFQFHHNRGFCPVPVTGYPGDFLS
jgi:adiponectin receptor